MKKTEFRRIYNPKNLLFLKKWTIYLCTFEKKIIIKKTTDFSDSL